MIGYLITCSPGMLEFDACDFYLTVFYLATSQQIKLMYIMANWNQMMLCFIHNEVLLLHITLYGKLNAVEESPGLTIFDMIGPTTTVSVGYKSRK